MKSIDAVSLILVSALSLVSCKKDEQHDLLNQSGPRNQLPPIDTAGNPATIYTLDTTFEYNDSTVVKSTSPLAPFLTEWGSYRNFKVPQIAGIDTSRIKVFRRIGPLVNYPWRELSYVDSVQRGAAPLYGGYFAKKDDVISTAIGIIGSPHVTIYVRITVL